MAQMVEQLQVARSPDEVWAVLADFGAISRWAPNVDHSSLTTDRPDGIGAQRRVQVGRNALVETLVDWEAGRRLGYSIDGLPPVVRSVVNTWTLEGVGGATTVTLTSRVEAGPRPPQRLVARVFGKVLAKASREMLAGLKQHVEENAA